MEDHPPTLDELSIPPPVNVTSVPLRTITSERPDLFARLRGFDPVDLAATFGGLLAVPGLQSNCIRLEVLAHLSLAIGHGRRREDTPLVTELFGALDDGICGRCEDPAEDVFVSSIGTSQGNFRVLEGIWESAGFYLQRIVNAVEAMPQGSGYDDLREGIFGLLRLSDLVCERAGLVRYQLGNDIPEKILPDDIVGQLDSIRRLVVFSREELCERGIPIDHLAVFGFAPGDLDVGYGQVETAAWYLVRQPSGGYDVLRVSANFAQAAVATRSIAASPFPGDAAIYFAGYDANKAVAHTTAWVARASLATALNAAR